MHGQEKMTQPAPISDLDVETCNEITLRNMYPLLALGEATSRDVFHLCSEFILSGIALEYLKRLGQLLKESLELPQEVDAENIVHALTRSRQRVGEVDPEFGNWLQDSFLSRVRLLCDSGIFAEPKAFGELVYIADALMFVLKGISETDVSDEEEAIIGFPAQFVDTIESSPFNLFIGLKAAEIRMQQTADDESQSSSTERRIRVIESLWRRSAKK